MTRAAALCLLLLVAVPARAAGEDQLLAGIEAYNRGDAITARDALRAAVRQGNAEAMVDLGYLYARGHAVQRDPDQALRLYRQAADAGDAEGMNAVGYRYNYASPPDYAAAVRWYCMAVLRGHTRAMNNLGILFANGQGVQRDIAEARSLWRQSAQRGHLNAQTNLGESLASDPSLPDGQRQDGMRMLYEAAMVGSAQGQALMRRHGYTGAFPPGRDMQLPMEKEPANPQPGRSLACEALVS
jgi:uncharacterized protein